MGVSLDTSLSETYVEPAALQREIERGLAFSGELFGDRAADSGSKGWIRCDEAAIQVEAIKEKAAEIRERAEVFVLVGVGGSNQAARAVIEALKGPSSPRVLYAGNSLSAPYLRGILDEIAGKSVYIDVIAKNFETLEPGSHYRALRTFMEKEYGPEEMARRVTLTGTRGGRLDEMARERGHLFLEFPRDIGGRYSAFSPVALLPMASAGLDIDAYLRGGRDMEGSLSQPDEGRIAIRHAALRNLLFAKGFLVETLVGFEPQLQYFSKWWWQLFGESEGKEGRGIYPSFALYSEDLHSIGQYMQSGQRILMETFLSVKESGASLIVEADPSADDRFDYLDGVDFNDINRAAEEATLRAHSEGGVPCARLAIDRIDEYHFGQLFYFFMLACAISGKLLGVNPFDQEGVERYKRSMFSALGKKSLD
jgi:Glucose-6-phosphate isomerase